MSDTKTIPLYTSPGANEHATLNPFMRIDGELWKLVGRKGSLGVFERVEIDEPDENGVTDLDRAIVEDA